MSSMLMRKGRPLWNPNALEATQVITCSLDWRRPTYWSMVYAPQKIARRSSASAGVRIPFSTYGVMSLCSARSNASRIAVPGQEVVSNTNYNMELYDEAKKKTTTTTGIYRYTASRESLCSLQSRGCSARPWSGPSRPKASPAQSPAGPWPARRRIWGETLGTSQSSGDSGVRKPRPDSTCRRE